MTSPLILAFAPPGDRARVLSTARGLGAVLYFKEPSDAPLESPPERILLGVGPAGCAALASCVSEHGIEGVRAVVLVDPSAPWAERSAALCPCGKNHSGAAVDFTNVNPLHLGPLEPLRRPAEMARSYYEPPHRPDDCSVCASGQGQCGPGLGPDARQPLKFVIACCPEAPPCEACGGRGDARSPGGMDGMVLTNTRRRKCPACSGTGRMLSSAEVARELGVNLGELPVGFERTGEHWFRKGGLESIGYPTRAALDAHGIEAALRAATEGR